MTDLSGPELDLLEYVASKEFIERANDFTELVKDRRSYPTLEEADEALGLPHGLMRIAIKIYMAAKEGRVAIVGAAVEGESGQ